MSCLTNCNILDLITKLHFLLFCLNTSLFYIIFMLFYFSLFFWVVLRLVLQVKTMEGIKNLKIPPGCQPGDTLKMENMGVPNMNKPSQRGDHHFIVNVRIPKNIRSEISLRIDEFCIL